MKGLSVIARGEWQLDCRSMPHPYPLLGARAAMALMKEGETLAILATSPETKLDLPVWCRLTGHMLVREESDSGVFGFLIRKSAKG